VNFVTVGKRITMQTDYRAMLDVAIEEAGARQAQPDIRDEDIGNAFRQMRRAA
jgi:hypothetical protein